MPKHLIHPVCHGALLSVCVTLVCSGCVSATPPGVVRFSDKVPEGKVSISSRSATLEKTAASTPVSENSATPGASQMAVKNSRASKITTVSKPLPATAGDSGSDPPNHLTNTLRTFARSTDNKDGGGASRFQKQPESIELSLPGDAPKSLSPMAAAVPAGPTASRGEIQQMSYELTDVESGQTPRAGTQQSSPNWLPRSTIVGPANAPGPSDNSANAPMARPASPIARRTPPRRRNQDSSSVTDAPSGSETNTPPADDGVAPHAVGSQTLSGTSADPFPRVEREPQQFPIQRGIPAPRNASLSILERQSQAMTEDEASPGDAIAATGQQSARTPTATETSSGSQMTGVPSLPFREQAHRDQKADARVASSNPVPEIAPHSKSQQSSERPQGGATPSSGKTGDVIEIWYGERQVFQSRNALTGRPTESRPLQKADREPALEDVGNSSVPKHANDDPKPFRPLPHAASELATVPLKGPENFPKPFRPLPHAASELATVPLKGPKKFPQAEEKQGREFQPVVNSPFPDASGDETDRAIRQTKFEDATMAAASGLSTQDDNLQRGGVTQAANSTEHADTNNEALWRNNQGHIPQTDAAQLLASPGQLIWPVVAIAFGLLFGVAIVFLFLAIAVRLIRPGQPQPLCNVSVVNGDRTFESDSEYGTFQGQVTTADQGTQRGLAAQNRVSHSPRRIRHNEPQPPVRKGFAKRMIESAMHDSGGFRPTAQPVPPATEPLVSHDGMMNDILRQNLAIRDQQPRKWVEN